MARRKTHEIADVAKRTPRPRSTPPSDEATTRDKLLDYTAGADFLGVTKKTLEDWICSGRYAVPYVKVGRLVRFRPEALRVWLRSRERGGPQSVTIGQAQPRQAAR